MKEQSFMCKRSVPLAAKLGIAVVLLGLLVGASLPGLRAPFSSQGVAQAFDEPRRSPFRFFHGVVTKVVDGDVVRVKLTGVAKERTVRLIGVNATDAAFTKRALAGKTVWLGYDVAPVERDRYRKRDMAYVWTKQPTSECAKDESEIRSGLFNARLILDGCGKVMTIHPNSRYADLFTKFEAEARKNRVGIWAERL
ncbi:MAG: thermonuclease family protein [Synergistaceae bacterium]|jgi:micrococcal nuclease|nr:thermonuclease family protein [Synergistaceae bacterium]